MTNGSTEARSAVQRQVAAARLPIRPRHTTARQCRVGGSEQPAPYGPLHRLLLHDMAPELADRAGPSSRCIGNEWRNSPLWVLGLAQQIKPRCGASCTDRAG